jgi:hypothetical protein
MSDNSRREREIKRYERELALQARDEIKMIAAERAKFEVAEYECKIEVLLTLHKEVGPTWDWKQISISLPPVPPMVSAWHEWKARQEAISKPQISRQDSEFALITAKANDIKCNQDKRQAYEDEFREWSRITSLARRILAGESAAYYEAMTEFSPLSELVELGSDLDFTIHSKSVIECVITMKDSGAIPSETKTLTTTGKLSVKPTPRARFHELYQDYICSGILRVAREVFALLPVNHAIITASVPVFHPTSGETGVKPVLSVLVQRSSVRDFNWEKIDPSDAIELLVHRGDFKASRKAGAFLPICALTPAIVGDNPDTGIGILASVATVTSLRNELKAELASISST